MRFANFLKVLIFLTLSFCGILYFNVANADVSGFETISPEGLTFDLGYNWRGTWGNARKVEYFWIKAVRNGEEIPRMVMKFDVSGFGYGEGYQLKAARKKLKELEEITARASLEGKELWVTRDLRYNEWDGLDFLPETVSTRVESETFEDYRDFPEVRNESRPSIFADFFQNLRKAHGNAPAIQE